MTAAHAFCQGVLSFTSVTVTPPHERGAPDERHQPCGVPVEVLEPERALAFGRAELHALRVERARVRIGGAEIVGRPAQLSYNFV